MKRLKYVAVIMALMLLFTVLPCTASSGKYDSIKDNPEIKQMMEAYNEHIKSNFILMSYLNQIVSSPSRLLESLKEQDCDEDILDFVENNKSFTLALTHIRIVLLLKSAQSNDQEIMYVTNMVQTGEFRYANASERSQVSMLFGQTGAYLIYDAYTKPQGLKDETENLFNILTAS